MNKKKLYKIFIAGEYPQIVNGKVVKVKVTDEMLAEIARVYDPNGYHEACVWKGHPAPSAEAEAWIPSLVHQPGALFCDFRDFESLAQLIAANKYKKVSVEFYHWQMLDGSMKWYLGALGLTNMPLVKGLPELTEEYLTFADKKADDKITAMINLKEEDGTPIFKFEDFSNNDFSQSNNTTMSITEPVKKFAGNLGINISNYGCDEDVLTYVKSQLDDVDKKYGGTGQVTSLSVYCTKCSEIATEHASMKGELTTLKASMETDKEKSANAVIAQGIAEGKFVIDSAEAKFYKAAAVNDPVAAASIVASLPKMKVLDQNVIQAGDVSVGSETPAAGEAKFVMVGAEKITAEDVVKDSKKMEMLNKDQLATLGFK